MKENNAKRKPLYKQIRRYLYSLIIENVSKGIDSIPSEMSIAYRFNVSRITSRKAIDELVEEGLLVRVKGSGTYLNKEKCAEMYEEIEKNSYDIEPEVPDSEKTVSLIVPDLRSKYMVDLLSGVQEEAKKNDWNVLVSCSEYDPDYERKLMNKAIKTSRGLIIYPISKTVQNQQIIRLSLNRYPIVAIDSAFDDAEMSTVTSKNKIATERIVDYFVYKGKKNIGVISHSFDSVASLNDRFKGYLKGLEYNGIKFNKDYCLSDLKHYDDGSIEMIKEFIGRNKQMDSIIVFANELGIKTLYALEEMKTKLTPLDVFIFDLEMDETARLLKYELNYVLQDALQIGRTAFRMMHRKAEGKSYINSHVMIDEKVIIQGSYRERSKKMKEILEDSLFENGLGCMGYTSADHYKVEKELEIPGQKGKRKWLLAPWSTKHGFENELEIIKNDDNIVFKNVAKEVTVYPEKGKIMLNANSGNEYLKPRQANEPWIHLLIEQVLTGKQRVNFSEMESCICELEFSIDKCENKMTEEEYNPTIHAAQVAWFITIENSKSLEVTVEGRPDYLWFGLSIFDNRGGGLENAHMMDYGTMKLIYSVGKEKTIGSQVEVGKKYHIEYNILPEVKKAFSLAQKEGSLKGAEFDNMVIGSMNLGWELPGTFDATLNIEKISIRYEEKKNK